MWWEKEKLTFKEKMVEGTYLYGLTEKQKLEYSNFTIFKKKSLLHQFKPDKFK
ncbi:MULTISPECIES: hypothetical protein [Staphylococcus]|uniref:hypothetical protein n=1 Tax=Staphylococcus TaxID=1279 RepID=UPI0012D2E6C1|nr:MULTISPECIES: hypothetical protein [Staphylococcus]MBA8760770.1 hypothetical protein [Staphylococcus coagulans]MBA8762915.1 hypothetical protein [Staphylococcus coagulans]MBA8769506.1 hypothetical protein [Staphylococcus coagulans]MTV20918.1 hypothetical protein [Staphylococcus delphini]